jgi:hypothetical protein
MAAESRADTLDGLDVISIACADDTGFLLYAIGSSTSVLTKYKKIKTRAKVGESMCHTSLAK